MKTWKIVIEANKEYQDFDEAVRMFSQMKEDIESAGFTLTEGETGIHLSVREHNTIKTDAGIDINYFTQLNETYTKNHINPQDTEEG